MANSGQHHYHCSHKLCTRHSQGIDSRAPFSVFGNVLSAHLWELGMLGKIQKN